MISKKNKKDILKKNEHNNFKIDTLPKDSISI